MNAFKISATMILVALVSFSTFAQCYKDSIKYKEIQFTKLHKNQKTFVYLNGEWIPGTDFIDIPTDQIMSISIKNDEYSNQAIFMEIPDKLLKLIKKKYKEYNVDSLYKIEPTCVFPGGNDRMRDWINANKKMPKDFDGATSIKVGFKVSPDGSVSDAKLLSRSTSDSVNQEALRIVNPMPQFIVEFPTPKNHPFYFSIWIDFCTPGRVFIR